MKKINKQAQLTQKENIENRLNNYLSQFPNGEAKSKKVTSSVLATLVPLAASNLLSTQVNGQCVFPITISPTQGIIYVDVDGDGLATFAFNNSSANRQKALVIGADPGASNARIGAVQTFTSSGSPGYTFAAVAGAETTNVYFAYINHFGSDPLSGGGTFNVIDANGITVPIDITIAPNGFITVNTINGMAPSTCSTNPILPVELVEFKLHATERSFKLNWATASEQNNKGFEVERSTDGTTFRKIGWVDGEGSSQVLNNYQFEDLSVRSDVKYYYRLRQVDHDGKANNSQIITGKIIGNEAVQFGDISPNPANSLMKFDVVTKEESDLKYELYDQYGKLVLQGKSMLNKGLNNVAIPVADMAAGAYFLKIQASEMTEYKKLVINR
jgi:Secretion system C-terminal sorting domain